METIIFKVQGSTTKPYTTSFKRIGTNLTAHCSCPAGENRQYCKHRLNILDGIADGIVSGNELEVQTILLWLKGTNLEKTLKKYREAEKIYEAARNELNGLKKKLSKSLQG